MAVSDSLNIKFIQNDELFGKVDDAISGLRPFFEADQGDIRLVGIDENYIVRVELLGSCKTCTINDMTLKAGIEDAVRRVAPEICGVKSI